MRVGNRWLISGLEVCFVCGEAGYWVYGIISYTEIEVADFRPGSLRKHLHGGERIVAFASCEAHAGHAALLHLSNGD